MNKNSYEVGFSIDDQGIKYASWEFSNFEAREVLKKDKSTGEYHFRFKKGVKDGDLDKFRKELGDSKMGMVDPSGFLSLEYPYYIIIESEMIKMDINNIFHSIDENLNK